jgi:tRNA(Met) C34 N-acetyltransferase TmcA
MKKCFPGVNPKEIAKQEVANAIGISRSTFMDKKGIHQKDNAHSVYVKPYNQSKFDLKTWLLTNLKVNLFAPIFWAVIFCGINEYDHPIRAMFENVYNPKPKAQSEKSPVLGIETKNKPFFRVNLSFALSYMLLTAGILMRHYRKDKRSETARFANENATVDLMLAIKSIKEAGKKVNLNVTDETVKKLIDVCPYIISRMSADERVYFDMLIDGDIESKNEEMFKNFALAVMDGHLRSNPEDLQMVLDAFDEMSIAVLLSDLYRQNAVTSFKQNAKTK